MASLRRGDGLLQVEVEEYREDEEIIRIRALIIVERNSQKGIIIK